MSRLGWAMAASVAVHLGGAALVVFRLADERPAPRGRAVETLGPGGGSSAARVLVEVELVSNGTSPGQGRGPGEPRAPDAVRPISQGPTAGAAGGGRAKRPDVEPVPLRPRKPEPASAPDVGPTREPALPDEQERESAAGGQENPASRPDDPAETTPTSGDSAAGAPGVVAAVGMGVGEGAGGASDVPSAGMGAPGVPAGPGGLGPVGASTGGRGSVRELEGRLAEAARRCYPSAARRFRLSGVVKLRFGVSEQGVATGASLVGSTGSSILDRAARECILTEASPLPRSVAAGSYEVEVRFLPQR